VPERSFEYGGPLGRKRGEVKVRNSKKSSLFPSKFLKADALPQGRKKKEKKTTQSCVKSGKGGYPIALGGRKGGCGLHR